MILDSSVMNVSMATVAKDVGTTVTGIETAITLYTLVMASFMITGKIGQIVGRKRAFAIGCVLDGCGSLTTAIAPSLGVLLVGWSCLEGIGAALILPAIVALVASNFAQDGRLRAYGLVASAGAMAVAVGPIIGGLFTTYLSWRYVFAGEVVIVVVVLFLARRMAEEPHGEEGATRPGGDRALGSGPRSHRVRDPALGNMGLREAQARRARMARPFTDDLVDARGGAIVWLFIEWENRLVARGSEPLIDPVILKNRVLRGGLISFFFQYFLVLGLFFAVPLFLSVALGLSAIETRAYPAALHHADPCSGGGPEVLPERITTPGSPARLPIAIRRTGGDGRRARCGSWTGDSDVADAARRPRNRGARVATWQHHRLSGPGYAERRGRRSSEHDHKPGRIDRHRTHRGDRHRCAEHNAFEPGVEQNPAVPAALKFRGHDQARRWCPIRLRRPVEDGTRPGERSPRGSRSHRRRNAKARLDGLRSALSVLDPSALIRLIASRRNPAKQPRSDDGDLSRANALALLHIAGLRELKAPGPRRVDVCSLCVLREGLLDRLAYREWGDRTAPGIVLWPGFGCDGRVFRLDGAGATGPRRRG